MDQARRHVLYTAALLSALTALKLALAGLGGLGDSEALYAAYSLHPGLGYLDHPPLIGWIVRATTLVSTSPLAVRLGPILLFIGTALLVHDVALRLTSSPRAAFLSVLLLCLVPVTFLGGLAATPDSPSALLWMLFSWLFLRHVREDIPSARPVSHGILIGLVIGAGFVAKYTNALLLLPLVVFVVARRPRWMATYLLPALLAALAAASPVLVWNHVHGWASLLHRLVWTQTEAGFSLRNLFALVGGQLLYVSPVVMVLILVEMARLLRDRSDDTRFALALVAWIPAAALWILCLWSRVAEPHWPAVAYLPVLCLVAGSWAAGSRVVRAGAVTAGVITALGLLAASTPIVSRLGVVEPRFDITNELYGWDRAAAGIHQATPADAVIVGPHWTICAQIEWALQDRTVSCLSPERDDYDSWRPVDPRDPSVYPRLYYVSDDRFRDRDPYILTLEARLLKKVEIVRGGRVVRTFRIYKR